MKTILISGGAGFIGSNFIPFFLQENSETQVVVIDKLTYAGNRDHLKSVADNPRFTFVEGDICDRPLLEKLFQTHTIDGVIHFAAESHVDNSISDPGVFIQSNIVGTFTLLDTAKKHWMTADNRYKKGFEHARFHHISTDEVYGSLGETGLFTEATPYAPNSPYSASKAASDFLVRSYFHTYQMNVVTTNCSNNYGPKQHDEKLIPTIIRKALSGAEIPIYGNGKNTRDWLFVADHCEGIALVYKKGTAGETYNIGGNNEWSNIDIAQKICEILDEIHPKETSYKEQITFVEDRPGHDFRYAIDASKLTNELAWKATNDFESGIQKTIQWYVAKYQNK